MMEVTRTDTVQESLLPTTDPQNRGGKVDSARASTVRSVFNILCGVVGAGVVGLPRGLAQTGWTSGVILLLVCAAASLFTGLVLSECADLMGQDEKRGGRIAESYADLGEYAAGKVGRVSVLVIQCLNQYTVGVLFLLLAAQNLHRATGVLTQCDWLVICAGIILLPSYLKGFKEVAIISFFGFVAAVLVVVIVVIQDGVTPDSPYIQPDHHYGNVTFTSWTLGYGVMAFGFTAHSVFVRMKGDMDRPEKFGSSMYISYFLTVCFYLPVAIATYYVYGQALLSTPHASNILLVIKRTPPVIACLVMIACHVMIGTIMFLNPLFRYIEDWVAPLQRSMTRSSAELPRRLFVRTVMIGIILFTAEAIPFFGDLQSFSGAFCSTAVAFVFPLWFHWAILRKSGKSLSWTRITVYAAIIAASLFAGISGAYFALQEIISPSEEYVLFGGC